MTTKRQVICDIEANGLLDSVSKVWCIVAKDYDTGEVFEWDPHNLHEFHSFAKEVHHWIGHNFLGYDMKVLKKLMNIKIAGNRVTDTLLVSRLQQYSRPGGHSLAAWGKQLGFPKQDFTDFSEYTPQMLEYCKNDVELNYQVACYLKLEGKDYGSKPAEEIEHASQYILDNQQEYGFALNVEKAIQLFTMFGNEANKLQAEILNEMPPIAKKVKEIEPKYKKDGTLSVVGLKFFNDHTVVQGPFTRIEWEVFNLASSKQKVNRLNPYWSPVVRTKGYRNLLDKLNGHHEKGLTVTQEEFDDLQQYMWQVSEENLATLSEDAPQSLKKLSEWAMYTARYKEVEGWLDALGDDDRVHGTVYSIGAITHRMSHNSPNMANIPGSDSPYGEDCRSCFTVSNPDTHVLLGCDAAGIQLRILAHYMNDPDYTKEVVDGDIHNKNLEAMGIDKGTYNAEEKQWSARATAKTFIYAWLLGAGSEKVGLICGGSPDYGRRVASQFLDSLPALAALKKRAAKTARVGRLVGLDGRYIEIKSAHFALSCYLQGAESCIMKRAMVTSHIDIAKKGIDAKQVAVVHDEFQFEVLKEHADTLGAILVKNIINAGLHFKLNCPLDAGYKIGTTWADTH